MKGMGDGGFLPGGWEVIDGSNMTIGIKYHRMDLILHKCCCLNNLKGKM